MIFRFSFTSLAFLQDFRFNQMEKIHLSLIACLLPNLGHVFLVIIWESFEMNKFIINFQYLNESIRADAGSEAKTRDI